MHTHPSCAKRCIQQMTIFEDICFREMHGFSWLSVYFFFSASSVKNTGRRFLHSHLIHSHIFAFDAFARNDVIILRPYLSLSPHILLSIFLSLLKTLTHACVRALSHDKNFSLESSCLYFLMHSLIRTIMARSERSTREQKSVFSAITIEKTQMKYCRR